MCVVGWNAGLRERSQEIPSIAPTVASKRDQSGKAGDEDDLDLPVFDLSTLIIATDKFSDANKLGQGGFGSVYKVD